MKSIIKQSLLLVFMAAILALTACGGGGSTQQVNHIDGGWLGEYTVTAPSNCAGYTGWWSASIQTSGTDLTGLFSCDQGSGNVTGTWDGTSQAMWSFGGAAGVTYRGAVSGDTITGTFSDGPDCDGQGPISGDFTGSRV